MKIITENTSSGRASQITNVYELLQITQHLPLIITPDDKQIVDAAARIAWTYPENPDAVLSDFNGSQGALAQGFASTLYRDYEESGIIVFVYPDSTQKIMNYIKASRTVTIEDEDDNNDNRIVKLPEYAFFDVLAYQKTSTSPASPEDGLMDTYLHGSKLASNIHSAETLQTLVAAYSSMKQPSLVYKVIFSGKTHTSFPTGTFIADRKNNYNYVIFPKAAYDDDTPIENSYEVLYDDPNDILSVIYAVNNTRYPIE